MNVAGVVSVSDPPRELPVTRGDAAEARRTMSHESPPCTLDSKSAKRNSGLFSFLRWFRASNSRESVCSADTPQHSASGSCESLSSVHSSGTVASFSYVPPYAYKTPNGPKLISQGPETDTYKARLKQRDKRREKDKNTTLRKKYNLFFNRDTLFRKKDDTNCKSLPLMTRTNCNNNNNGQEERSGHRRTNSESSKLKKAGAYCHVKGKRKAPAPPPEGFPIGADSTASLRRKKRLAPQPPGPLTPDTFERAGANMDTEVEYADAVLCNDSLRLEGGILVSAKREEEEARSSARNSYVEAPVSPRPWYKRNKDGRGKGERKVGPVEEGPRARNSTVDLLEFHEYEYEHEHELLGNVLRNLNKFDSHFANICP